MRRKIANPIKVKRGGIHMDLTTNGNGYKCDVFEEKANAFIFAQPKSFTLYGEHHEANYWIELIDKLCVALKRKNNQTLDAFLEDEKKRKNRLPYLAKEEASIHYTKVMEESKLIANQKIDAPRSVRLIRQLLDKFEVKCEDFCLFLQEELPQHQNN